MNKVKIYALIDPRCGSVRYVGRTINKLSRRLMEHVSTSLRGKMKDRRKELWVRELNQSGLMPVIQLIDEVGRDEFKEAEKQWIAKYKSDGADLLNARAGGDGGLGGHFVRWTQELDALLGVRSDSYIAAILNVNRKSVSYRRERLGIPASFDRTNAKPPPKNTKGKRVIPDWLIEKLGSMPDHEFAELAGVDKKRAMQERKDRGIASYASSTGRDGKFEKKIPDDSPIYELLGKVSDVEISRAYGISSPHLCLLRKRRGIPRFSKNGTSIATTSN